MMLPTQFALATLGDAIQIEWFVFELNYPCWGNKVGKGYNWIEI